MEQIPGYLKIIEPDNLVRAQRKKELLLEGPGNQQHIGLAVDVDKLHRQCAGARIDQLPELFGLVEQILIPDHLAALIRSQAEVDLPGFRLQLQGEAVLRIFSDKLLIRLERLEPVGIFDPNAGRLVFIKLNEQL